MVQEPAGSGVARVYRRLAVHTGLPYVQACPTSSRCAPCGEVGGRRTPRTRPRTREAPWTSAADSGGWTAVERRFRDGHTETWWAADLEVAGYGPGGYTRLVAATTDPAALPAASTWYLVTNLPHPQVAPSALAPTDGPGGDRAAMRTTPVGGARVSAREGGAGVGRFLGPLRPCHPVALAARLLRLLLLLVGLPVPARHDRGRSGARDGPRFGDGVGGEKREPTGDHPTLSWPVTLRQV